MLRTTHFAANGDIQTAYHETGGGEPFILVHGYTGSKLDFHDQLNWFADLTRVIAYDQRGHGESSNRGPYTFEQLVDDLIGLLDGLDLARCHLLGHSLGGMVVIRAALARPDRVRSLILMDTSAEPVTVTPAEQRAELNAVVAERGCDALLELMAHEPARDVERRGVEFLGPAEHQRRLAVKLAQMDPDAFAELGDVLEQQPPVLDALAAITCRTTVLVGAEDDPFLEPSRRMADVIPGSDLVAIPAAGHNPQYENAQAWRDAVRAHLDGAG